MKLFVCPWVGNTGVIMADYEEAATNIEGFLRDGKKTGAIGTDITVWNDSGETLYGLGWWSIVYGAACAWEPGATPVEDFNRKFDWVFYRNTDHRFAGAIERLSRVNETLRGNKVGQMYDMDYGGTSDGLFWHDPFSPEGQADVTHALPVAPDVRRTAEQVYTGIVTSASRAHRNQDTLPYLEFAALKIDALAMRYEFAQEISQLYASALAHEHDKNQDLAGNELGEIESTNGRLDDLRDYTTRPRELYRELWLWRICRTGCPMSSSAMTATAPCGRILSRSSPASRTSTAMASPCRRRVRWVWLRWRRLSRLCPSRGSTIGSASLPPCRRRSARRPLI